MTILKNKTNRSKARKARKDLSVRFHHSSVVYDKFRREEREGMWYKTHDFKTFLNEIKTNIIESRKLGLSDTICLRGIEQLYSNGILRNLRNARKFHVEKVLLTQAKQRQEGRMCPEEIQFVSMGSSMESWERAQILGEQDSTDAQLIFMENFRQHLAELSTVDVKFRPQHSKLILDFD